MQPIDPVRTIVEEIAGYNPKWLAVARRDIIDRAKAALSRPGADGEAVAWLHEHQKFGKEVTFDNDVAGLEERRGWIKTPLYASPPAPVTEAMLGKIIVAIEPYIKDGYANAASAKLTAALGTATAGTGDCHDKAHDDPAHNWRTACLKCGVFRGSDLYAAQGE